MQVYFMSSSRETSWTLPLSVCLELDADQQDFIRDRIYEFEQRSKRTARAKKTPLADGQQSSPVVSVPPSPFPIDASGYIKPSPSPTPAASPTSRPESVYPPGTDRDKTRRASEDVIYMCMNRAAGKQ